LKIHVDQGLRLKIQEIFESFRDGFELDLIGRGRLGFLREEIGEVGGSERVEMRD